ncbi:MAG: hypothetical protein IPG71_05215 [bacterium]|nr:hypothetical protein [bacterium]
MSHSWRWPLLIAVGLTGLVLWGGQRSEGAAVGRLPVFAASSQIGEIELRHLSPDGQLRLGFKGAGVDAVSQHRLEWWQLAEREDRPGYPRIDPQSGGSGLPGAKGEDEDPAYYSPADFATPELAARIFAEGGLYLLDRPTHDSGFRLESWLVQRIGPKHVKRLVGVRWGITVRDGALVALHHPEPVAQRSRFDWEESLRISGFGIGWDIEDERGGILP